MENYIWADGSSKRLRQALQTNFELKFGLTHQINLQKRPENLQCSLDTPMHIVLDIVYLHELIFILTYTLNVRVTYSVLPTARIYPLMLISAI